MTKKPTTPPAGRYTPPINHLDLARARAKESHTGPTPVQPPKKTRSRRK